MIRVLEESGLILDDDYYEEDWNDEESPYRGSPRVPWPVKSAARPSGPRRAAVAYSPSPR